MRRPSRECKPGDTFDSSLLTLDTLVTKDCRRYWVCTCECGRKTIPIRQDRVVKGIVRSCGCLRRKTGADHHLWKGHGEIHAATYSNLTNQARIRGIACDVSIDHLWELYAKQDGKCALTGVQLTLSSLNSRKLGKEQTASVDRIDSSIGYVEGNVWWVHKDVNRMKREYPLDRFLEICRLVTEHTAQRA